MTSCFVIPANAGISTCEITVEIPDEGLPSNALRLSKPNSGMTLAIGGAA